MGGGTRRAHLGVGSSLLSGLSRKNGWRMAERAGHATPHRIQKFLSEASWDAGALLAEVQDNCACLPGLNPVERVRH